jgi:hypothetical protein
MDFGDTPEVGMNEDRFHFVLECPCGEFVTADDEDTLVDLSFKHLRANHPDRAHSYERDHILFMSRRVVR